jgi:hypothetical protein
MVDSAALHDSQNGIAILFGIHKPLEQHDPPAFAAPIAVGSGIKGLASAIR